MKSTPTVTPAEARFLQDSVRNLLSTLMILPGSTAAEQAATREAAVRSLMALAPTDTVEVMLATQIVAAHHAILDSYRRAAHPDASAEAAHRQRGIAASLTRLSATMRRNLEKRQAVPHDPAEPVATPIRAAPVAETPQPAPGHRPSPPAAAPMIDPRTRPIVERPALPHSAIFSEPPAKPAYKSALHATTAAGRSPPAVAPAFA